MPFAPVPGTGRRNLPVMLITATGACIAAMGGRALLQPWLGDALVFVFAFPAVVACTLLAGAVCGALTMALCIGWYLFAALPPSPRAGSGLLESGLFLFTGALVVAAIAYAQYRARPPRPAPLDATESDVNTVFWLQTAVVLSVVLPLAGLAAAGLVARDNALAAAERRMANLATIAEEHALKLFETGELLIEQAGMLVEDLDGPQIRERQGELYDQLARITRGLPQVQSVWIVDAEGHPVASSRMAQPPPELSYADRPGFIAHRESNGEVIVTPSRTGSLVKEQYFALSRRRTGEDGAFAGVTMVGLHPGYFTNFYQQLADSERGVVLTLLHADGHVIARWPETAAPGARLGASSAMLGPMAQGAREGRTHGASSIDGVTRIGSWRRVGKYPVYVFAGTDERSALAGWQRDVGALAAFIVPLSLLLSLISLQALRRTREHIAAARQLRREAEERQKVEAALRQSQKLEAVGHLTGGVAHDFNNLLMVVNLNASLLRSRVGPDHERQLEAIERAVAAGKKLTRQLLAFARRQPLLPKLVDPAEIIPAMADLVRPALGSSIGLEAEVAPGTRCFTIDTGELELALINLAVNARDAMPDGGMLRLDVRNDGDMVQIAVKDTGTGIPPEDVERVFEPFFTTKPVGAGTGLGLSQVYGLCARAGGEARIESRVGEGTTVFLRFPGSECTTAEPPAEAKPVQETLSLRVLMVEDNRDVAIATRELLEGAGSQVSHAVNPAEALEILETGRRFDIVLSDIVMPGGVDGLQFAQEVQRLYPKLPIVLMTGYVQKLREVEAHHFVVLPKPFEPELLLKTLREQAKAG